MIRELEMMLKDMPDTSVPLLLAKITRFRAAFQFKPGFSRRFYDADVKVFAAVQHLRCLVASATGPAAAGKATLEAVSGRRYVANLLYDAIMLLSSGSGYLEQLARDAQAAKDRPALLNYPGAVGGIEDKREAPDRDRSERKMMAKQPRLEPKVPNFYSTHTGPTHKQHNMTPDTFALYKAARAEAVQARFDKELASHYDNNCWCCAFLKLRRADGDFHSFKDCPRLPEATKRCLLMRSPHGPKKQSEL